MAATALLGFTLYDLASGEFRRKVQRIAHDKYHPPERQLAPLVLTAYLDMPPGVRQTVKTLLTVR